MITQHEYLHIFCNANAAIISQAIKLIENLLFQIRLPCKKHIK